MLTWLDDALRLVGRLLLLGLVALACFVVAGIALKPAFPLGLPAGPERILVIGFVASFSFAVANVVGVLAFERADWGVAGLHRRAWRPLPLAWSTGAGLAVVLVPAAVLLGTGHLVIEETAAGAWGAAALTSLLWLAAPALAEELVLRGYAFGAVERQWGPAAAIAATSLAFGLLHLGNPGATAWTVAAVVVAGVFLGAIRSATGSLVAAWLAHLAVNWAQGAVLHAPISGLAFLPTPGYRVVTGGPAWLTGGAWGLEAGAATAAALLVVSFLVLAAARRRRAPVRGRT
jgi:membrane protease YdiL (CAAX protease family)